MIGSRAGENVVQGLDNTLIGTRTEVGLDNLTNATAIGAQAQVSQDDSLVLGSISGVNGATADTRVGIGTTAPKERLEVQNGNILIGSAGRGIVLKSPDGSLCRLLTIADATGALVLGAVPCP